MNLYTTITSALLAAFVGCNGSPSSDLDASEGDAGARACVNDDDCDDGSFCNGAESCVDGECAAGAAPSCDDGDDCTVDSCAATVCSHVTVDADGDGFPSLACGGVDCDDDDAARFRGNAEQCDEHDVDEDCDPTTFGERDVDGDGAFDIRCCNREEGDFCGTDCDDVRAAVGPLGVEACDGVDNDCNGVVDEGVAVEGFVDLDGDLRGDPDSPISSCPGVPGFSTISDDCDDDDVTRHGAQTEVCDTIDNDCDGRVDEDTRDVAWYADDDGDGFGDPSADPVRSCVPVVGRSLLGTDCNDGDPSVHPAAAERCNGVDDNCDGFANYRVGPGDFEDDDGDTFLDAACTGGVDCDDRNPEVAGGFVEICDGRDNDCDSEIDERASSILWFADLDGDGYGSSASGAVVSCVAVGGHALRGGDCDDRDPTRRPSATEQCDGLDEDCDAAIDEGVRRDCGGVVGACTPGLEACVVGVWGDCSGVEPMTESCNGIDDDCDGLVDDGLSCP